MIKNKFKNVFPLFAARTDNVFEGISYFIWKIEIKMGGLFSLRFLFWHYFWIYNFEKCMIALKYNTLRNNIVWKYSLKSG